MKNTLLDRLNEIKANIAVNGVVADGKRTTRLSTRRWDAVQYAVMMTHEFEPAKEQGIFKAGPFGDEINLPELARRYHGYSEEVANSPITPASADRLIRLARQILRQVEPGCWEWAEQPHNRKHG